MVTYKWVRQPKHAPKAQTAGQYIEKLSKTHGGVSAQLLVHVSQPERALFHQCFTWDNKRAAQLHREEEARLILRSLILVAQESDDAEPVRVNAFVNLADGPDYIPVGRVIKDGDMDRQYKKMLLADLHGCKRKCQQYDEFREVCQAISHVRIH